MSAEPTDPANVESFDRRWPNGWETHACPTYDGKVMSHAKGFHRDATLSPYQTVGEQRLDRLALMTERWLRAEEDAERLAGAMRDRWVRLSVANRPLARGVVTSALACHDERKAEEA